MFEAQLRRISAFDVGCNSANGNELDNISLVGLRSFLSRACFADVIVLMCNGLAFLPCLIVRWDRRYGQIQMRPKGKK